MNHGHAGRYLHIASEKLETDTPCITACTSTIFKICNAGNKAKKAPDVKATSSPFEEVRPYQPKIPGYLKRLLEI